MAADHSLKNFIFSQISEHLIGAETQKPKFSVWIQAKYTCQIATGNQNAKGGS